MANATLFLNCYLTWVKQFAISHEKRFGNPDKKAVGKSAAKIVGQIYYCVQKKYGKLFLVHTAQAFFAALYVCST